MILVIYQQHIGLFSDTDRTDSVIDSYALCRISCCCKNRICFRNIERHCNLHAVVQAGCGSCDGSVCQCCFTVFHKYFLTAQFIFSIFHTACHHGITDQNDTFRSEHTECCTDCTAMNVQTITDQLGIYMIVVCSCSDNTRCSVI